VTRTASGSVVGIDIFIVILAQYVAHRNTVLPKTVSVVVCSKRVFAWYFADLLAIHIYNSCRNATVRRAHLIFCDWLSANQWLVKSRQTTTNDVLCLLSNGHFRCDVDLALCGCSQPRFDFDSTAIRLRPRNWHVNFCSVERCRNKLERSERGAELSVTYDDVFIYSAVYYEKTIVIKIEKIV